MHPSPDQSTGCCDEYALSRRQFLRTISAAAGAAATTSVFGSAVLQTSFGGPAAASSGGRVLVVLSLRGGADMLSVVVPHGDPGYYAARPTIAVPKGALLHPDAMFGLHPAMAPLADMWKAGRLAAVTAVGLPVPNRSHFDAMEQIEDADPGDGMRTGWINRMIGLNAATSVTEAIQMGSGMVPTALYGPQPALAVADVDQIALSGPTGRNRARALRQVWADTRGDLGDGAREALATARAFRGVAGHGYRPAPGASYPADDLGDALKEAARLIKADLGARAITLDYGSWDMHARLGTVDAGDADSMHMMVDGLAHGLKAFFADLGPAAGRVTLVTLTEFGRRVAENGSRGLDHGWGNTMLLAGAGVRGGRVHGRWPGLDAAHLNEGDLAVTTDYRSVLAEVLSTRFGTSTAKVFPGFTPERVGVMT